MRDCVREDCGKTVCGETVAHSLAAVARLQKGDGKTAVSLAEYN